MNDVLHGEYKEYDTNGPTVLHKFFMHGEEYSLKDVMDIQNKTPEDEITLSLLFGNNFIKEN